MRYRAGPSDDRRVIEADGVALVYHRPSGMTHILAPPMPEILAALAPAPATLAELADRLPSGWELRAEDTSLLEARLEELVETGLVSRA